MRSTFLTLSLAALAAAPSAFAGDLDQVVDVGRATWSTARVGVVCDAEASRERIQELARLMGGGTLTVADVRHAENVGRATSALRLANPAYLVLFPDDPIVRDGSFAGTVAIHAMASYDVPTLATTRVGLQQGAAAAIGPDTGNQLLLNHDLKGSIFVSGGYKASSLGGGTGNGSGNGGGMARIVYLAEN
ncbi:MAG TPA: hypothetical protein VJ600_00535 [Holophagaceae bacterium]|nr:hypothetical protein [Holophagaceae bacterium]